MMALSLVLVLVPFIPGVRALPHATKVYRPKARSPRPSPADPDRLGPGTTGGQPRQAKRVVVTNSRACRTRVRSTKPARSSASKHSEMVRIAWSV